MEYSTEVSSPSLADTDTDNTGKESETETTSLAEFEASEDTEGEEIKETLKEAVIELVNESTGDESMHPMSTGENDYPVFDWKVPASFKPAIPTTLSFAELISEATRLEECLVQVEPTKMKLPGFKQILGNQTFPALKKFDDETVMPKKLKRCQKNFALDRCSDQQDQRVWHTQENRLLNIYEKLFGDEENFVEKPENSSIPVVKSITVEEDPLHFYFDGIGTYHEQFKPAILDSSQAKQYNQSKAESRWHIADEDLQQPRNVEGSWNGSKKDQDLEAFNFKQFKMSLQNNDDKLGF